MEELSLDEEFREAEREAAIERIRILREASAEDILASFLEHDRRTRLDDPRVLELKRMRIDPERDAELDRLDRLCEP